MNNHSPNDLCKRSIKISQSIFSYEKLFSTCLGEMFTLIQNKIHELQSTGKRLQSEPLERISDVVFMTLKRASESGKPINILTTIFLDQPAEVIVRKEAEYLLKTDRQKEMVDFVVVQPHVLKLIDEVHKFF